MPNWGWIVIAVLAVVAIVALVVAVSATAKRKQNERLKDHFGPEYERIVDETGDERAAQRELADRQKHRRKLDIRPLTPEAHAQFSQQWQAVQTHFVDDPTAAVGDADRLVTQLMRERGYPVDDFEQRAADISVDHPRVVESYRGAHSVYESLSDGRGDVGTEDQREAFVHYRALFQKLLETDNDHSQEARA